MYGSDDGFWQGLGGLVMEDDVGCYVRDDRGEGVKNYAVGGSSWGFVTRKERKLRWQIILGMRLRLEKSLTGTTSNIR